MKKHFKAVELKYLDDETIKKIREWRNQSFVRELMYTQQEITEEEHNSFIDSFFKSEKRGLFVFYLDDEPFGVYQYIYHPEGNYVTDGNYLIKQEYQDLGYGVIQVYFMNIIKFEYLKCHKSYAEMLANNKRVIMLNEKMGAHLEGVLREHYLIEGRYYDIYCYGQLEKEWIENRKKYENLIFKIVDKKYKIYI